MAKDPYKVLGITKSASDEEIRKAYRALAKKYHPDLNTDDKKAEERFKEISVAYDVLGDPDKRKKFDAGEIDAAGAEQQQRQYYRDYAGRDPRYAYQFRDAGAEAEDLGDIFSTFFGGRGRAGGRAMPMAGQDVQYQLSVEFLEAVKGDKKRVTMPDGKSLDIRIPPGIRDGQSLRLKGKGGPGINGGPAGDAFVTVTVKPHVLFERDGNNIRIDLPISLDEAVLGAKIDVPTIEGSVSLSIPAGSNNGAVLRLKGKGVGGKGDQYVRLKLVLPDKPDDKLKTFLEEWREQNPQQTRRDWG